MEFALLLAWLVVLLAVAFALTLPWEIFLDRLPVRDLSKPMRHGAFGAYRCKPTILNSDVVRVWFPFWVPIQHEFLDPFSYGRPQPLIKLSWPVILGCKCGGRWAFAVSYIPYECD